MAEKDLPRDGDLLAQPPCTQFSEFGAITRTGPDPGGAPGSKAFEEPMEERRHVKRVAVTVECALLPGTLSVQVLDLSIGGVLLHASRSVPVGSRGALRLSLAGLPVTADVVVERIVEARGGYRIGASFAAISNEHRQVIERFMSQ